MLRKNKIRLLIKLPRMLRKKLRRLPMLLIKLLKKKPLVMPLTKPQRRLKRVPINQRKMLPLLRPTVTKLLLMLRLLVIRSPTPQMLLEKQLKLLPRELPRKPTRLKLPLKKQRMVPLKQKVMLKQLLQRLSLEPHQKNE